MSELSIGDIVLAHGRVDSLVDKKKARRFIERVGTDAQRVMFLGWGVRCEGRIVQDDEPWQGGERYLTSIESTRVAMVCRVSPRKRYLKPFAVLPEDIEVIP